MNALVEQLKENKDNVKDQVEGGGGGFAPPAEGPCFARCVGYVEIGKRKQRAFQGKEKPPALECIVMFELFGKKHQIEVGEGDDKRIVYPIIRVRTAVKGGDRSNYTKLFRAMDYGRGTSPQNIAFFVGEAFKVTVTHNEGKDGNIYANLRNDSSWQIGAPVREVEDESGDLVSQTVKVPAPTKDLQMLVWSAPTADQWDSIFIDGTRTQKDDDGNEVEVSKNWLQEDILKNALDFKGSALEAVLNTAGSKATSKKSTGSSRKPVESEEDDLATSEPETTSKAVSKPENGSEDDPLGDLDL